MGSSELGSRSGYLSAGGRAGLGDPVWCCEGIVWLGGKRRRTILWSKVAMAAIQSVTALLEHEQPQCGLDGSTQVNHV